MNDEMISSAELLKIQNDNNLYILDVRTIDEYFDGHLWNSIHRPMNSLPDSIMDIPKNSTIVTVCIPIAI